LSWENRKAVEREDLLQGRLNTVDLLALTSFDKFYFTLKISFTFLKVTKINKNYKYMFMYGCKIPILQPLILAN
jgi:hypothetical protein